MLAHALSPVRWSVVAFAASLVLVVACGKSDRPADAPAGAEPKAAPSAASAVAPAPEAKALVTAPYKVSWERSVTGPSKKFSLSTAADGTVTDDDGKSAGTKFEANTYREIGGGRNNVELEVDADGNVFDGHHRPFGKFTADDGLAFEHVASTLRVLDDGTVVAEGASAKDRTPIGARVSPVNAQTRRPALVEIAQFASMAPDVRKLLGPSK